MPDLIVSSEELLGFGGLSNCPRFLTAISSDALAPTHGSLRGSFLILVTTNLALVGVQSIPRMNGILEQMTENNFSEVLEDAGCGIHGFHVKKKLTFLTPKENLPRFYSTRENSTLKYQVLVKKISLAKCPTIFLKNTRRNVCTVKRYQVE